MKVYTSFNIKNSDFKFYENKGLNYIEKRGIHSKKKLGIHSIVVESLLNLLFTRLLSIHIVSPSLCPVRPRGDFL